MACANIILDFCWLQTTTGHNKDFVSSFSFSTRSLCFYPRKSEQHFSAMKQQRASHSHKERKTVFNRRKSPGFLGGNVQKRGWKKERFNRAALRIQCRRPFPTEFGSQGIGPLSSYGLLSIWHSIWTREGGSGRMDSVVLRVRTFCCWVCLKGKGKL